ncbi:MAG: S9 family peptidase [Melioribacteraceae bacterium]
MYKIILSLTIYFFLFSNILSQKKPFTIEDIYKVKSVGSPAISNDANKLLFTVTSYDLPNSESNTDIYISNIDGSNKRQLTNNKSADFNPIWANDDSGIYFVSYRSGSAQLFYMPLNGGEIKQVTDFEMGISSSKLSPDGNNIIFTSQIFPELGVDEEKTKDLLDAMNTGPVQAHLTDSLFVRHWTEYNDGQYSHVVLYNLESESYTDLTPGYYNSPTFSAGGSDDYNFSPDSKQIVFSSKRVSDPESSTNSDVWIVNVDGTNLKNLTEQNKAYDGFGKFSPDGKYIAYRTQLIPVYESDKWRLVIKNLQTGETKILTEQIDNHVNNFVWTSDSKNIYFSIDEKGYNPLLKINIENKKITRVLEGKSLHGFTISPKDDFIVYGYSYTHKPIELAKLDLNSDKANEITNINKQFLEEVDVRSSEQIWVKSPSGKMIQTFLVKPHNFNPNKKYPLIINVHGGPQMQWRNSYRSDWQVYPGAGYVLAYPNPHGSTGFGKEFTKDISTGWDGNVYKDVMSVMDSLQNLPFIDKDRMGAMGWSYGGYFMNLLQAKGNRFKCLASMMGIYDLEQFYLDTEELWFPDVDLGGDPWQQKELYDKQSPSKYVENFKTPTLIITGERDYRVTYLHSLRYFTALQKKGIDSRLIIFDNDGHWPSHLKSMPLYYNSHLEWFHKYLGGAKAPWDSKELIRNQIFK